jgi:hypothetical protein
MSTRYNNGSHYENHQRAAELHDLAAHAHRAAAEQDGKQDHLTGQERSRQSLEHSRNAHESTAELHRGANMEHGVAAFGREEIAARAHEIWQSSGCPEGTAEADWFRAAEELRSRI